MCLLIEGQPPRHLIKASISPAFGLELIEALLLNHAEVFSTHPEQADLLLNRVMPLINSCLSERQGFSITVRGVRVFCILMREHLDTVQSECEVAFGLLNHTIETETQQAWRRALCMETFRLLYSNPELFVEVYSRFDLVDNKRNIIQDNQALFVRVASEKPALIGLGQHSTAPSTKTPDTTKDQATVGAEAAAGMIGGDFGVSEKDVPGISDEWSTLRVSCLDQLDKVDGPTVPETYIYSLVLTCVNQLSDILAKVVLPVAMHQTKSRRSKSPVPRAEADDSQRPATSDESPLKPPRRQPSSRAARSRSIPTNPLDLQDHPAYAAVKVVASVISSCWPAVLATSSTFFNCALDAEFYRSLVRSFQKFTQVAGILHLTTPRDALLTSLSKFAVPSSLLGHESIATSPPVGATSPGGSVRYQGFPGPIADAFSSSGADTPPKSRRSSLDVTGPSLSQRNLVCLRALVHLAIALGPILDSAWSIVLDSTQKAHVLLLTAKPSAIANEYRTAQSQVDAGNAVPTLGSEISAVESATSRLFQSTSEYPSEAFKTFLVALCDLLRSDPAGGPDVRPQRATATLTAPPKLQKRAPSVSGLVMKATAQPAYSYFAVSKLGETAKANLERLSNRRSDGWHLLVDTLHEVATSKDAESATRKMAADILARLAVEACVSSIKVDPDSRTEVQRKSFVVLHNQVSNLTHANGQMPGSLDMEIHQTTLESLHSILDHCGDSVVTGWDLIFSIVSSVFEPTKAKEASQTGEQGLVSSRPLSAKLARSSFASLQLICSDFMGSLSQENLQDLVELLARFGLQTLDINVSLTVVAQLWNVSDYLQKQISHFDLSPTLNKDTSKGQGYHLSVSVVWLVLQQRLAILTCDGRADVRNGSIHTIFRTLDSCGSQLSGISLAIYIHTVLFKMMDLDSQRQMESTSEDMAQDTSTAIQASSKIVIDGCARFFASNHTSIQQLNDFDNVWQKFLKIFVVYLDAGSFSLSRAIFMALSQILAVEEAGELSQDSIGKVAGLWAQYTPIEKASKSEDGTDQQSACVAYVRCVRGIFKRLEGQLPESKASLILQRLQVCVSDCVAGPYTNDIERSTELQDEILQSYDELLADNQQHRPTIISHLALLSRLPYAKPEGQELTFVAFSKKVMNLIPGAIAENGMVKNFVDEDAVASTLDSLNASIKRQYAFQAQGKEPKLWQKATLTAVSILESISSTAARRSQPLQSIQNLYKAIVRIADQIQAAHYDQEPPDEVLIPDESFDLDAIAKVRRLITPTLDSTEGLDEARLQYIDTLYQASTLHLLSFDDTGEPLCSLIAGGPGLISRVRPGRTRNPDFKPRVRMCYSCFDELLVLATSATTTTSDSDNEFELDRKEALLAPIAHQALLLRCAIPVKRYIADQPLRGRMPTPMSQRLELLHILGRVHELYATKSSDSKLPNFDKVAPGWPGILEALAPLLNQAREPARRDGELAGAMGRVSGLTLAR